MIRTLLLGLALAGCGKTAPGATGTTATECAGEPLPDPHIVILLLDDVGWTGLSGGQTSIGNGSDYHETPRMDALADQSVSFDAAYASPQCQPARAALLTGQHAGRTKMYANFDSNRADAALRTLDAPATLERLPLDATTLAEMLGPQGYRTAHIGKWHIGVDGADGPEEQGFDVNIGGTDAGSISGGLDDHWSYMDGHYQLPNLGPTEAGQQFAADRITDEAIAWLGEDLTTPGLVVLSHFSVHTPIQAPDEDQAVFDGKPPGTHHSEPVYAAMLHNLDRNVGRVVDYLEHTADPRRSCDMLIDNTLLIAVSDNGAVGGFASEGVQTSREISNQLPLRSGKGTAWEGGMRVPMIIRWDRAERAGSIVHEPVQHVDLVPTILDLAGRTPPATPLDGISLRPVLETGEPLGRDYVFFHFPAYLDYIDEGIDDRLRESPVSIAWDGKTKLAWRYETASWERYDLDVDIGETNDLGGDPAFEPMASALVAWLQATGADMPLIEGTNTPVGLPDPGAL